MCILGGIVLPVGLFWFAWTNSTSLPWAASVCASIPFGFGLVLVFLGIMNYLIDSYTIFAASVLAANSIIRCVMGAAFPLFTKQMYEGLGIHWASSIPGFLALACIPMPFFFYKYGALIRSKCKYAAEADAFMQRIRNQAAQKAQARQAVEEDTSNTSRASTLQAEEEEEEAEMVAHEEEHSPRFQEMKTEKEMENELKKIATGRSSRSRRSVRAGDDYYDNPYEIDRVNTRESFTNNTKRNSGQR